MWPGNGAGDVTWEWGGRYGQSRGGSAGPAGPALARPLFQPT